MSLYHKMLLTMASKRSLIIVLTLVAIMLSSTPASGGVDVVFYNDPEGLHSIVNSLGKVLKGTEDFEEMASDIKFFDFFDDPLQFGKPNLPDGFPFPAGMTGLSNLIVQSNTLKDPSILSPLGTDGLIAVPLGDFDFVSDAVLNGNNTTSLDLIFPDGKSGVGFNILSPFNNEPLLVRVYSTDNVLLGSNNALGSPNAFHYIGMWSPTALIGRINIMTKTFGNVGADNIEAWQLPKSFNCGDKGAGDCHVVNGTPACDDLICCEMVCEIDPFCCVSEWDIICVQEADDLCIAPPFNDSCANAISVQVGEIVAGSTNGSSIDDDFPDCDEASITTGGVWYVVTGTGNTMTVSTCGGPQDYDTKISVFCSACDDPVCVAGNDDDNQCAKYTLHSTASWCSQKGIQYLILVHGFDNETGDFELTISDDGVPCGQVNCVPFPCPWDLDDSGNVSTNDLLLLFAQWGTAGSADFDGNGVVNTEDMLILFAHWGPCL